MPYAVNLGDLMSFKDDMALAILLSPVIDRDPDSIVDCESGRFDGMAARLTCDGDRAEAIVSIIRQRLKKFELRLYHSNTGNGSWKRV
jgi:hypothetical protein